jgi:hypothetical protein
MAHPALIGLDSVPSHPIQRTDIQRTDVFETNPWTEAHNAGI